jgi:SAM-dependent methyltransferase
MQPKPAYLGNEFGAQFSDMSVVDAYHFRPAYPAAVFQQLVTLFPASSRRVLDLGCGTGELARPLAPLVDFVDAVDVSGPMLQKARQSPGGSAENIRWIHSRAENAPLRPPYDLVVAGASLHWMEWDVVMPCIASSLAPGGLLAIVEQVEIEKPAWAAAISPILGRYSTNRDFRPYDVVQELRERNLFEIVGRFQSAADTVSQPISDYIESFHARNGFSRNRMSPEDARSFDREMDAAIRRHVSGDNVTLHICGTVVWGKPAL